MLGLAVIPAKAGIQGFQTFLDPGLSTLRSRATAQDGRRGDVLGMEFSLS